MMRLEEGQSYRFLPLKTIVLPDMHENLILSGPDRRKYLLPLSYYQGYGLADKNEIICKVDKINCTGRVFLEPEHPVYREGLSYTFLVEEKLHEYGEGGEKITVRVKDALANIINVPLRLLNSVPEPGTVITLKVERISKGKIHFSLPLPKDQMDDLNEGEWYDFVIESVETDNEGDKYFVVKDTNKKDHRLPVRYYRHYGFSPGDSFRGRIIRYSAGSHKSIEPENPWYNPGDIVEVTVESFIKDESDTGWIAYVNDDNGFSYSVKFAGKPLNDRVQCSVLKIRKGRPVLIPLEEK